MMRNQRNRNQYNRKTIVIVFVLVCLVSFGIFLIFSPGRSTQILTTKSLTADQRIPGDDTSVDSDNDGLKDWEEQIYGTNPHNADTDGDKTSDSDEIAQNRNPLKSSPNDIVTKKNTSLVTAQDLQDQSNLSKKMAEIFTQDYLLHLLQNPLEEPNFDDITNKMVQTALKNSPSLVSTLTINDIIVLQNTNKDAIKDYMEKFISIVKIAAKPISDKKTSLQAVGDFIKNHDDSAAIKSLTERIEISNTFLRDIRKLPVPKEFVSLHLSYLNTSIQEGEAVKKILKIKDDAFLAIIGIEEFIQAEAKFPSIVESYLKLLTDKGISIATQ